MKIIFTGTSDFAAGILDYLVANKATVSHVISQPDRPKGRKLILTPSPVSHVAIENELPLFKPENISSTEFVNTLKEIDADLMIVIAYGQILKESVLQLFPSGCVNVHASLLPKYRGAAPIQRAIINGELETGITTMFMDKGLDSGDMILKTTIPIENNDTYGTLHDKLLELAKKTLMDTLEQIEKKSFERTSQNHQEATYAKKINKKDCLINWNHPAEAIHNLVRGVNPIPGAFAPVLLNGKTVYLKIWETDMVTDQSSVSPGTLLKMTKDEIVIKTNPGALRLRVIQLPGKNKLSVKQFMAGYVLTKDSFLAE